MTLPNDSILVTPGSGATLATQLVSSKEYEAWIAANGNGALDIDANGVWTASFTDTTGGLSTTETDRFSLLNGDATLVVDVLGAWVKFFIASAPPVLATYTRLSRCTAHSGGSTITPVAADTATSALDADIVVRSRPTSVTRTGEPLGQWHTVLTAASNHRRAWLWNWKDVGTPIVCRQNEGVTIHDFSEFTSGGGTAFAFGVVFRVR